MEVVTQTVAAEDLQKTIKMEKDLGRRILAVAPATLKKEGLRSSSYTVTQFVLVTQ